MFLCSESEFEKEKYWDNLRKTAKASKKPVIINNPVPKIRNRDYENLLTLENRTKEIDANIPILYSNSIEFENITCSYGHVKNSEFERLTKLLDELKGHPNIRIHGCFQGFCTQNLAIQIAWYLKTQKNFYQYFEKYYQDPTLLKFVFDNVRERFFYNFLECQDLISKSGVKYGVVFNSPKQSLSRSLASKFLPIKTLDEQLIDENTILCG